MCAAAARRERGDAKGNEESEMREARRTRGARRSAAKRRRRPCGPSRHGEELCATAVRREKEKVGNGRVNNRLHFVYGFLETTQRNDLNPHHRYTGKCNEEEKIQNFKRKYRQEINKILKCSVGPVNLLSRARTFTLFYVG